MKVHFLLRKLLGKALISLPFVCASTSLGGFLFSDFDMLTYKDFASNNGQFAAGATNIQVTNASG